MKKGLSILVTLTLIVSLLAPFSVGATLPGNENVTGAGQVTTMGVAADILGGVLPTAANLNFVIDPMGLLAIDGTGANAVVDTTFRNNVIDFTGADVLEAWNTSSFPVLLTVNLSVTAGNGAGAVLTEAALEGTAANVLMWMEPSAAVLTEALDDLDDFVGLGRVIPYGTTVVPVNFILQEVEHDIVVDGPANPQGVVPVRLEQSDDNDQYGTAFRFGGLINPDASWTGTTVSVSANFTMVRASADILESSIPMVAPNNAYGLLASTDGSVTAAVAANRLIDRPVGSVGGSTFHVTAPYYLWIEIPNWTAPVTWVSINGTFSFPQNVTDGINNGVFWTMVPEGTSTVRIYTTGDVLYREVTAIR